jgi:hypothetical protein
MPRKLVDLSARSRIIREEPWQLHFWESSPGEALEFLRDPRRELEAMGIRIPPDCRIETVITNHDWIAAATRGFVAEGDDGPIVVCNVGGGDTAINFYRVTMYGHSERDVGRYEKRLLHSEQEEAVKLS